MMNINEMVKLMKSEYLFEDDGIVTKNKIQERLRNGFSDIGVDPSLVSYASKFLDSMFICFSRVKGEKNFKAKNVRKNMSSAEKKAQKKKEYQEYYQGVMAQQDAYAQLLSDPTQENLDKLNELISMSVNGSLVEDFFPALKNMIQKADYSIDKKGLLDFSCCMMDRYEDRSLTRAISISAFNIHSGGLRKALSDISEKVQDLSNTLLIRILYMKGEELSIDGEKISKEEVQRQLKADYEEHKEYFEDFEDFAKKCRFFYNKFSKKKKTRGFGTYFFGDKKKEISSAEYKAHKELRDSGYLWFDIGWSESSDFKYVIVGNVSGKLKSFEETSEEYQKSKNCWEAERVKLYEQDSDFVLFVEDMIESKYGPIEKMKLRTFKTIVKKLDKEFGKRGDKTPSIHDYFESLDPNHTFSQSEQFMYGLDVTLMQFLFNNKKQFYKLCKDHDGKRTFAKVVEESYHWGKNSINVSTFQNSTSILLGGNYLNYSMSIEGEGLVIKFDNPLSGKEVHFVVCNNKYLSDLEILSGNPNRKDNNYTISYSTGGKARFIAKSKEPRIFFNRKTKKWEIAFQLSDVSPLNGKFGKQGEFLSNLRKFVYNHVAKSPSKLNISDNNCRAVAYDLGIRNVGAWSSFDFSYKDGVLGGYKYLTSGSLRSKSESSEMDQGYYFVLNLKKIVKLIPVVKKSIIDDPELKRQFIGVLNENGNTVGLGNIGKLDIASRKAVQSFHNCIQQINYYVDTYADHIDKISAKDFVDDIDGIKVLDEDDPYVVKILSHLPEDVEGNQDDILNISLLKWKTSNAQFVPPLIQEAKAIMSRIKRENLDNIRGKKTQVVTQKTFHKIKFAKALLSLMKSWSSIGTVRVVKTDQIYGKKIWDYINGLRRNVLTYLSSAIVNNALDLGAHMIILEDLDSSVSKYREKDKNAIQSLWGSGELKKRIEEKAEKHRVVVQYVSPYLTSQLDNETKDIGYRKGGRLYVVRNGKIKSIDADINASKNIGERFFDRDLIQTLSGVVVEDQSTVYILQKRNVSSDNRKRFYKKFLEDVGGKSKKDAVLKMGDHGELEVERLIDGKKLDIDGKKILVDGEKVPFRNTSVYYSPKKKKWVSKELRCNHIKLTVEEQDIK